MATAKAAAKTATAAIYRLHEGDVDDPDLQELDELDIALVLELAAGGPHAHLAAWKPLRLRTRDRQPNDLYIGPIGYVLSPRVRDVLAAHARPDDAVRFLPMILETPAGALDYAVLYFERFFDVLSKTRSTFTADGSLVRPAFDAHKCAGRRLFGIADMTNHYAFVDETTAEALRQLEPRQLELRPQPMDPESGFRSS